MRECMAHGAPYSRQERGGGARGGKFHVCMAHGALLVCLACMWEWMGIKCWCWWGFTCVRDAYPPHGVGGTCMYGPQSLTLSWFRTLGGTHGLEGDCMYGPYLVLRGVYPLSWL